MDEILEEKLQKEYGKTLEELSEVTGGSAIVNPAGICPRCGEFSGRFLKFYDPERPDQGIWYYCQRCGYNSNDD